MIRFIEQSEASKGIIVNSIHSPDGNCISDLSYNMLQPFDIPFGKNFTISCTGSLNVKSYLHSVAKVAQFYDASATFTNDWVEITDSTSSADDCLKNLVISISYQKQGRKTNPSLLVVAAQKYCFTNASKSAQGSFSVLFYEEPQSSAYYLSKPKEIQLKLSRDVLYPFFEFDS